MADWDERYRRGEHATAEPSRLLVRAVEHLAPGRALDIACGAGRHAVYLASRGWRVTAVDASRVGVELMQERARLCGAELDARVADLERGEFRIEADAYDLVCDFYYLQRDLFAQLQAGVCAGALFVAAIHMTDEAPDLKPMNPDFLLEPGELRTFFEGWQIEHYHETPTHDPDAGDHTRRTAEIIAVKK
ncbi:MAG: methyltransferase domain-containing protein [Acidobacteria bacterium]|nr:methyltransferase domain-containing protein [Acidobacteriota bacterium]